VGGSRGWIGVSEFGAASKSGKGGGVGERLVASGREQHVLYQSEHKRGS